MPIIHTEGFWNLPVNPVWRVPGIMKEGKADNEHSNPVLLPLVPEFTNICISHLQLLHFQNFLLEVVAIGRKNAGQESDKNYICYNLQVRGSMGPLQPSSWPGVDNFYFGKITLCSMSQKGFQLKIHFEHLAKVKHSVSVQM
jgi:hypothetical protein